jgi:hypothetical protein
MKKLRLNVESLRVESFSPAPSQAATRGTVYPRESAEPQSIVASCECPPTGGQTTCAGVVTCDWWSCLCQGTAATCGENTCYQYSCAESCNPCVPHG